VNDVEMVDIDECVDKVSPFKKSIKNWKHPNKN